MPTLMASLAFGKYLSWCRKRDGPDYASYRPRTQPIDAGILVSLPARQIVLGRLCFQREMICKMVYAEGMGWCRMAALRWVFTGASPPSNSRRVDDLLSTN
jgi:hypothetical protein